MAMQTTKGPHERELRWTRKEMMWGEWKTGGGRKSDKGVATCQPRIGHNNHMHILGL
jgi:hypothetical protein